jgi:formamidopyrimidine-DNA glycosylase
MNLDYILLLSQIHRAETCYRARVHPDEPARALSADTLALLWHRTVELWKLGFV